MAAVYIENERAEKKFSRLIIGVWNEGKKGGCDMLGKKVAAT